MPQIGDTMLHIAFALLYAVSGGLTSLPGAAASAVSEQFSDLIQSYSYAAVFVLMLLEGIGFPIPSEVVIPLAGYYAATGALNPALSFLAVFAGSTGGLLIDYFIGYYVEKDVVYKHLHFFRINKHSLAHFDSWFNSNGTFAVFIARLIPEVRALISLPAGFAKMPLGRFMLASVTGTLVWDAVLMWFGYTLQSVNSVYLLLTAIGVFGMVLYVLYRYGTKWMGAKGRHASGKSH